MDNIIDINSIKSIKVDPVTVELDGKEFKLVNPVITDIICDYDDEHRCIRSETVVNATLVGGKEEKRVTDFFYNDKGFRTVSKSSDKDKETESIVTHDDQDRLLKIESPVSITEYEYFDGGMNVVTKDIINETVTEEQYKDIDGKSRQVSQIVKTATGEIISMITRNYVLDKDKLVIKIMNKAVPFDIHVVNVYKYSTDQMLSTTNGFIGNYANANLKYIYDDKDRLVQIQVIEDDDIVDIIDYDIEELDDTTYITKSNIESILQKNDGHLRYSDIVIFKPIADFDQDVHVQHIDLYEYSANVNIDIAYSDKQDMGRCERFECNAPELEISYTKINNSNGEEVVKAFELNFRIGKKMYYINTDFNRILTKALVTTYNDFGSEESTHDITFKTSDNDKSVLEYILSKFKEYIETDEKLQEIMKMSKVSLDI